MIEVVRYTAEHADEWNAFVARSKNGTFLFNRAYMDYHADRFTDHSFLVYRKERLIALLPGNITGTTFYSHQGLSYGGLITDLQITSQVSCDVFDKVNSLLRTEGFTRVVYKAVPHIYHFIPAEEDLYALFARCHARLVDRNVSAVLSIPTSIKFTESRRSGIRKALRNGLEVRESRDIDVFWKILSDNLERQYHSKPVHTVDEMKLLMDRFPQQIKLYMTFKNEEPLGGTVLYLTPRVVRTQYISASVEGKQTGALDLLFDEILHRIEFSQSFFDFGTSAQTHSCDILQSLIFQKEGFGGRGMCYDVYEYEL